MDAWNRKIMAAERLFAYELGHIEISSRQKLKVFYLLKPRPGESPFD
jgi:hypothetical protein